MVAVYVYANMTFVNREKIKIADNKKW